MTTTASSREIRAAIYSRKSVTEGLDQDFNSLDAQREAGENYVKSQKGAAWVAIPEQYDDGGFSGSNTERPAFQRLLRDIQAGLVDVVVVYKIDRLSRSFRDFMRVLEFFEKYGVEFVSVTQQFSTTSSMGKLVLNILMSFAEYEREQICERIRDKVRATRRRGAQTGGRPVLGYDPIDKKLVVNEDEARQVRAIYELYLQHGSLRETLAELNRRGWRNKTFINKQGGTVAGKPLTRNSLHRLLTNVLYRGQLTCGDEVIDAVHDAIIQQDLWDAVQARLRAGSEGKSKARNKTGALLRGLVFCGRCGSRMTHTFSKKRAREYRYYVCTRLHNEGAGACPDARVAAGKFEEHVVEQIKVIGQDQGLQAQTAAAADALNAKSQGDRRSERRRIEQESRCVESQREALLGTELPSAKDAKPVLAEIEKLATRLEELQQRDEEVQAEQHAIGNDLDDTTLCAALEGFLPIWDQLFPLEQERILQLFIEKITYDPDTKDIEIELRDCGIEELAAEARKAS